MTLATLQSDFLSYILQEDKGLPASWNERMAEGLAIYRNAYRARLVEALRETYPKTATWVGDAAFEAAAAHHLISHPPGHWNLDEAGRGFANTLMELFENDAEVAELAWLEWAMHQAFVVADGDPLDAQRFAETTSDFSPNGWENLRLRFVPGLQQRAVGTDLQRLYKAFASGSQPGESALQTLTEPKHCLVWRENLTPVFCLLDTVEGEALLSMRSGSSYGEVCTRLADSLGEGEAIRHGGAMLGHWLALGLVSAVIS